jgi:threonine synthase
MSDGGPSWPRWYRCRSCGSEHEPDAVRWRCDCGGLLDLVGGHFRFPSAEEMRTRRKDLWRWSEALPFAADDPVVDEVAMGEGAVPAIRAHAGACEVLATLEYASPTLSFKDRGAAVLVAAARRAGANRLVADSSGNAGTAIAAYAARAGLDCEVFVAKSVSPAKLAQVRAHRAEVHLVEGTREDVATAAVDRVETSGAFYASHVWNPFFLEGTKTWAFDAFFASGPHLDVVVVPVGNGTMLLGAHLGFGELVRAGHLPRMPRLVAVQAEACAPIAAAFRAGDDEVRPVTGRPTVAEGIAVAAPARGTQCLDAVRSSGGIVVTVTEGDIAVARAELAAQGLYVEPTAAAVVAGVTAAGLGSGDRGVVLPLCGAGIKSPG